jgi:hypothetical protein
MISAQDALMVTLSGMAAGCETRDSVLTALTGRVRAGTVLLVTPLGIRVVLGRRRDDSGMAAPMRCVPAFRNLGRGVF